LHVGLLVHLDLDVARLHLVEHLRHEVEAAEQDLARRHAPVGQTCATAACQKPVSK
jgi:hypothetical protein